MDILIRNETAADYDAITDITKAAFADCAHGAHTEHFIVIALRRAGALTLSLVAEHEGAVVGHIAFSPITISDGTANWYGLGPVSVLPALQRRGIGKALIREGLARLRAMRAGGCVLVGDPAYYRPLGFENLPGLVFEGVPPENLLSMAFGRESVAGNVGIHEAFWVHE